jgi:hypothetical protein
MAFHAGSSSAAGAAKRLSFHEFVCHLPRLSGNVCLWQILLI